jgi:uncharacterized protein (TIGR00369 family)
MNDYRQLLNDIIAGEVTGSKISSSAAQTLDMPRLLEWSPGKVLAEWQCSPCYMNSRGVLFGGYYGVLADVVLAFAAMTVMEGSELYSTQDLSLSFFKPVSGGVIRMPAEVVTRTRSRIYTECRFMDERDKVLAVASASQHVKVLQK